MQKKFITIAFQSLLLVSGTLLLTGCVGGNDRSDYDASISTTVSIDEDRVVPEELREPVLELDEILEQVEEEQPAEEEILEEGDETEDILEEPIE